MSAGGTSGKCVAAGCACASFDSQLYRPGLCVTCFHTIALHYPGQWTEVQDETTGRVFYTSGDRKLLAQVKDDKVVAKVAQLKHMENRRIRAGTLTDTAGLAPQQSDAWTLFLQGPASTTNDAPEIVRPPVDRLQAAGGAPAGLPPKKPVPALPQLTESTDADDDDEEVGDEIARAQAAATPRAVATMFQTAAATVPDAPSAVPQAALAALAIDLSTLSRRLGATSVQVAFEPVPVDGVGAASSSVIITSPTDVHERAREHGLPTADVGAPVTHFGSASTSEAPLAAPGLQNAVVGDALNVSPSDVLPGVPLVARQDTATHATEGEGAGASVSADSTAAAGLGLELVSSTSAPSAPPANGDDVSAALPGTGASQAPSSQGTPGPSIDLSVHLGPVYDDPLTVRLDTPAFSKETAGVLLFRVAQPYEEDFTVPRYLVVTPFTLMAVAPHPTKLNVGIVKWERSILSLNTLVSQPLFTAISAKARIVATPGHGHSNSVDAVFSKDRGVADKNKQGRDSRADSLSLDDFVLDQLPYGMEASAMAGTSRPGTAEPGAAAGGQQGAVVAWGETEAPGAAVKLGRRSLSSQIAGAARNFFMGSKTNDGSSSARGRGKASSKGNAAKAGGSPLLGAQPAPNEAVKYKLSGIGLLASFSPESGDTITLLRTYRAGRRPQRMAGWLWKRKRQAWREHAPLGPLAWKRRYFVLEPGHITYYVKPGGDVKGLVPLTGWVEVSRVGPDAGPAASLGDATTKPNCFVVRTGRTYHVFQAASDGDADAWVDAIAINAQHSGCALDEPQCLILPNHADAEALAKAVEKRRADLQASLGADSAYGGVGGMLVDLSASEIIAQAAVAQQVATAAAMADEYEVRQQMMQAQMASLDMANAEAAAAAAAAEAAALPPEEPAEGTVSIAEAEALYIAMGELSDDFLGQLPRSVQLEMRRRHMPETVEVAQAEFTRRDGIRIAATQAADAAAAAAVSAAQGGASGYPSRPASIGLGVPISGPLPSAGVRNMPASAGAVPEHGTGAAAGSAAAQTLAAYGPSLWVYVDDSGRPQGPFPEEAMRSWLMARYFSATTMVHAASPLTPQEMAQPIEAETADGDDSTGSLRPVVDDSNIPTVFLPLSAMFPDPASAFTGVRSWVGRYRKGTAYQSLYNAAVNIGIEPNTALVAVLLMKDNSMGPSLGRMLDLLGDSEWGGVIAADAEERNAAAAARARASGSAVSRAAAAGGSSATDRRPDISASGSEESSSIRNVIASPTSTIQPGARSDHAVGFHPNSFAPQPYGQTAPGMQSHYGQGGASSGPGAMPMPPPPASLPPPPASAPPGPGSARLTSGQRDGTGLVGATVVGAGLFSLLG